MYVRMKKSILGCISAEESLFSGDRPGKTGNQTVAVPADPCYTG